ncbi:unnamed protein product [Colias eurytheme]|nr:unnamed protein product [Colias eurytheme]
MDKREKQIAQWLEEASDEEEVGGSDSEPELDVITQSDHDSDNLVTNLQLQALQNATSGSSFALEIQHKNKGSCSHSDTVNSIIFEVVDNDDSQKENKWNKWHPKALKTRKSNVLTPAASKASVTSKLDKLSEARLELVQLQMEASKKELEYKEKEHRCKMLHLANERRKNEIHALLMKKLKCGIIPNNMI